MVTIVRRLMVVMLVLLASGQTVTAQEDTFELTVGARLCGAADEVGNTCHPLDGLTISVADETGTSIGSCTTEPYDGAGSTCTVDVPLGTTITVSVAPDDIPDNTTMSVINASITVPDDPTAPQEAVPTFQFIDDTMLEQTAAPAEPVDEVPADPEEEVEPQEEIESDQPDAANDEQAQGEDEQTSDEPEVSAGVGEESDNGWRETLLEPLVLGAIAIGVLLLAGLAFTVGRRGKR